MVKIFKRSAAGDEEQLPSDLRPPPVLKRTCDYLFNELIGNAPSLAKVHNFVWNRTRAIRRDFSIQQLSKPEDLAIAIECYERIARFHILSLHELAQATKPYPEYDYKQDREQLDKTLLSLMQYYDDSRDRVPLKNEAEFRGYCVIFQLQDFTPDLEDRVQSWPFSVGNSLPVRKALEIYAAASSISDLKGPLKSSAIQQFHSRQDWQAFWKHVESPGTSFLQACVAEIFFNTIRYQLLDGLVRTARKQRKGQPNQNHFLPLDELTNLLAFDDDGETIDFCKRYRLGIQLQNDGKTVISIESVAGAPLAEAQTAAPPLKTLLVENKRYGRSFPAVINGMSVKEAVDAGMVNEGEEEMEDYDVTEVGSEGPADIQQSASLFVPEATKPAGQTTSIFNSGGMTNTTQAPAAPATGNPFAFGKPSAATTAPSTGIFGAATKPAEPTPTTNLFAPKPSNGENQTSASKQSSSIFGASSAPSSNFNFLGKPAESAGSKSKVDLGNSIFSKPAEAKKADAPTVTSPAAAPLFQWPSKPATPSTFENAGSEEKKAEESTTPKQSLFQNPGAATENASSGTKQSGLVQFTPPAKPQEASAPKPTFGFTTEPKAAEADQPSSSPGFSFLKSASKPAVPSTTPPSASPTGLQPTQSTQPTQPTQTTATNGNTPSAPVNGNTLSTDEQKLRRSSTGTKPKKPSPLSNSFSADDQNAQGAGSAAPKFSNNPIPKSPLSGFSTPAAATPVVKPPLTLDSIVERLAVEISFDPYRGILKQFVEFHVSQVITEIQEKLYYERVNKEADDFRRFSLAFRYGKKWRETCRRRRLARQGKERRRRAHRRLQESSNYDGSDAGSVTDTTSLAAAAASRSGFAMPRSRPVDKQTTVDALFQSTNGGSPYSAERFAAATNKRPAAIDSHHGPGELRSSAHKRIKSNDHDHEQLRRSTLSSLDDPREDLKRRAAFLGFSLPHDAPDRGTTTKTTYFKMKALGIDPNGTSFASRGAKRPRAESLNAESTAASTPRLGWSSVHNSSSPEQDRAVSIDSRMLPPPRKTPRSTGNDPDEALFARLRAVRENLQQDTSLLRSSLNRAPDSVRSVSVRSASDSPSMVLARAEARLRASQGSSRLRATSKDRDVPAYRLRESRFVPREHYGRAIERANEIRSNRSRESSRPGSRMDASPYGSPSANKVNFQADSRFDSHSFDTTIHSPSLQSVPGQHNGGVHMMEFSGLNDSQMSSFQDTASQIETPKAALSNGHREPETSDAPMVLDQALAAPQSFVDSETAPSLQESAVHANDMPQALRPESAHKGFNTFNGPVSWGFSPAEPAVTTQEASQQPDQDVVMETQPASQTFQEAPIADSFEVTDVSGTNYLSWMSNAALGNSDLAFPQDHQQTLDHTIARDEIPAALSASFGPATVVPTVQEHVQAEVAVTNDDKGTVQAEPNEPEPQLADADKSRSPDLGASFGHKNPFAALMGGHGDESDEDEQEEEEDEEAEEGEADEVEDEEAVSDEDENPVDSLGALDKGQNYESDNEESYYSEEEDGGRGNNRPMNGVEYDSEDVEDEGSEGDVEDFDEYDDGEETPEEEEEEEEEYDYDDDSQERPQRYGYEGAQPNAELQGVGGTVEEAIELSD